MIHQDWEPVILKRKHVPTPTEKKNEIKIHYGTNHKTLENLEKSTEPVSLNLVGKSIGKQITEARVAKKLTQIQLANQIRGGLDVNILKTYENGTAIKNGDILNRICQTLNLKLNK